MAWWKRLTAIYKHRFGKKEKYPKGMVGRDSGRRKGGHKIIYCYR